MKKSLSVALVVAMVSSMFASMAFADDATTTPAAPLTAQQKYDALAAKGILDGTENGADLNGLTTRAQIAKILTVAFGLTQDTTSAGVYKDLDGAGWAAGYIGAVTKAGLMDGVADGKFDPSSNVTLEQVATVLVRAFKLDTTSTDVGSATVDGWAKGYVAAAIKSGLISASSDFTASAKRSDLVYSAYVAVQGANVVKLTADTWTVVDSKNVKVSFSDGTSQTFPLATALVAGQETAVTVSYQGKDFMSKVTLPVVSAQDIKGAAALSSKVVEVTLNTAATQVDASQFTVKDSSGNAVAIASAAIAPYSTDSKTVLVTLGADTTAGALYTVTSGTKTVNFGGKGVDTTKPVVSSVKSVDYNIVDITFNRAVDISSASVTINEKYASSNALAVSSKNYNGKTVLRVMTDDQKAATLYGLTISGVKDFAGNTMDSDSAETFVGTAKSTNKEGVNGASAYDYKTVVVSFNENVDPSALVAANFTINQAYGTQSAVAVASVRAATTSDYYNGVKIPDAATARKYAVVTLNDGLQAGTLYKVTVANVGTLYGQVLDSTKTTANFAGISAPTSLTIAGVTAASNTKVDVKFANKLDAASATTLANYSIAKTYGDKAALAISAASLDSDGVTVHLTVAAMTQDLYTITVNNVKDAYGNTNKTDSSANVINFAGAAVAPKISSVTAQLSATDATQLKLTFNQNVGPSATDISHYSIDGGVGYPTAAALVSGDSKSVNLTIPKTNNGQIYNVTVTGLENSDLVAMDSAGIKTTFVGSGVAQANPSVVAAITLDNQTVEVYFDQAVAGTKIKNVIWNGTNAVNNGVLQFTNLSTATVDLSTGTAWADPGNANALIVRFATAQFNPAQAPANNTFTLTAPTASQALFASNKYTAVFAANSNAPVAPVVSSVTALNKGTVRVYFNQAVANVNGEVWTSIDTTNKIGAGTQITLGTPIAADTTNMVWDIPVTGATYLDQQSTPYYFFLTTATDKSGQVQAKDENSGVGKRENRQFAGSTADIGSISSVAVSMTDARTLVVYYPEAMNQTLAKTAANYTIVDGTGASLLGTNTISNVAYDTATNKVTLTLSGDLTASTTGYYLQFSNAITNAVGNRHVQKSYTDGTVVKSQFAPNTAAAAKVTVSSVTYATYNSNPQITVKLNMNSAVAVSTPTDIVKNFKVNVVLADGTVYTVAAGDIASVDTALAANTNTLAFSLHGLSLKAGSVGSVQFQSTGATITGVNGMAVDTSPSAVFAEQ